MSAVDLVTDASWCPRTGVAAWAAWARSPRGLPILVGNALPNTHGQINVPEMLAVLRGLQAAFKRGVLAPCDHVTLQTDSTFVAWRLSPDWLSRGQLRRREEGVPDPPDALAHLWGSPRGQILRFVGEHTLSMEIVRSSAGVAMGWVDQFARECMREARRARHPDVVARERMP